MTKDAYLEGIEIYKLKIKDAEEYKKTLKEDYIESNKPCNIGDYVDIILCSERLVKNVKVCSFGILKDKKVCITSYKKDSKMKYITTPHLEIINKI